MRVAVIGVMTVVCVPIIAACGIGLVVMYGSRACLFWHSSILHAYSTYIEVTVSISVDRSAVCRL